MCRQRHNVVRVVHEPVYNGFGAFVSIVYVGAFEELVHKGEMWPLAAKMAGYMLHALHLGKKVAFALEYVVLGMHISNDAFHKANGECGGGYAHAQMSQEGTYAQRAQEGGFSGHIGACEQHKIEAIAKRNIVGNGCAEQGVVYAFGMKGNRLLCLQGGEHPAVLHGGPGHRLPGIEAGIGGHEAVDGVLHLAAGTVLQQGQLPKWGTLRNGGDGSGKFMFQLAFDGGELVLQQGG